jgi:Uma2 family endonuclease
MSTAAASTIRDEHLLTIEELADAVGDRPGELVRGRFIDMPPTGEPHGEIEATLTYELTRHNKAGGRGKGRGGEIGIITGRAPDTVRGADVVFISHARLARRGTGSGYLDVAPELVVEIISPNDRWTDINDKLAEYFAIGVDRVWLVNPKRRQVSVYRSPTDVALLDVSGTLVGCDILQGFELPVAELFGR